MTLVLQAVLVSCVLVQMQGCSSAPLHGANNVASMQYHSMDNMATSGLCCESHKTLNNPVFRNYIFEYIVECIFVSEADLRSYESMAEMKSEPGTVVVT